MPNNIAILSLHTPNLQPLADLTWPNKVEYASHHGYQTHCKTDGFTLEHASGEKIPFIRQFFREHPEVEWAWFVDTDTLITNFRVPIEWCLDPEYHFVISCDINGINAGSFFVRNSPEGIEFLDWMIAVYPAFVNAHGFFAEQEIINFVLGRKPFHQPDVPIDIGLARRFPEKLIKIQHQRMFNSYAPEANVGPEGTWQAGDFLVHWPAFTMEARTGWLYQRYSNLIIRMERDVFSIPARRPLVDKIMERTGGKVCQGPFEGMVIRPEWMWGDGDTAGKLLGIYENELHAAIEDVILWRPNTIVNFGCAEGFYGIGVGLRTSPDFITFIDIDQRALDITERNLDANREIPAIDIDFDTDISPEYLDKALASNRPFLFMDCEGYEEEILNVGKVPTLLKSRIIVETHDCIRPNLTMKLIERFRRSHDIQVIGQGAKNPYLDITADLDDVQKMLIACEFRPSTMYWLYMVPK